MRKKILNEDFLEMICVVILYLLGIWQGYSIGNSHKQLMGDVNQDGKVSISDMAIVKSHILGNSELTYEQMDLADMNNDAVIDVVDILEIRRIILSKDSN